MSRSAPATSLFEARRAVAFARHIPLRQLGRRLVLTVRRGVERRLRPDLTAAPAFLRDDAPLPLFGPWHDQAERTAGEWQFSFLARPLRCANPIDWQLGGAGPANQLWRMNLHYFEWAEGLADRDFIAAVDQWLAACPPFVPGADQDGWTAYALSLRVVVWLQQLASRRERLGSEWILDVTQQVARQLHYLEAHVETDIGGNHLVKNIAALLWGSAAIASPDALRWRSTGIALLRRELHQILPDGMHFERSPSYHGQVLGDMLGIRHAALGCDPLGGALDAAITRAAQGLADVTHPDGGPALFGDAGLTMARRPSELLAAAHRVTGAAIVPRAAFDVGGYAGLRQGMDLIIVDAGPLGPDRLPGHAHGDIGSFEWSVAGERMIVDQGVFTYVAGERRQASRSASQHNTLAAPGVDQGEFFGAFRLGRRTRIATRAVELSDDELQVDVAHDGFVGSAGRARHHRRLSATRDQIVIEDNIDRDLAGAAISFLLAPGVEPSLDGKTVTLTGPNATCRIASDGNATIEEAVWWPDMGVERATYRVRVTLVGRRCCTTLSVIARKEA